jgi:hypothetical protein
MSHATLQLPTLEEALARVGSGAGFGSVVVRNGRSRTGHIWCEQVGGALCGVEQRVSAYYDTDCDNSDDEFPAWLRLNWELGICRACLRSLPNK